MRELSLFSGPRHASAFSFLKPHPWPGPPVALFWDQSLVWGLLVLGALDELGVPVRLLSGPDIAGGALEGFRVLIVPGGWASHKLRALGEDGAEAVRRFVLKGGGYLGFCGGAGLALSGAGGLSLAPVERLPLEERLPNASGEVWIAGDSAHPIWKDLPSHLPVSIWWPGQFAAVSGGSGAVRPLARYDRPGEGFMVADLPVADVTGLQHRSEAAGGVAHGWDKWEKLYGINLDPAKLLNQPAILEVKAGEGRLILSYPHLETPGDVWGQRLLLNVLHYLDHAEGSDSSCHAHSREGRSVPPLPWREGLGVGEPMDWQEFLDHPPPGPLPSREGGNMRSCISALRQALDEAEELIRFGERHLLWSWRNSWLLNWRRGLRGLEYGTLAVCLKEAVWAAEAVSTGDLAHAPLEEGADRLLKETRLFARKARQLLIEEKLAGQVGQVTKLGTVNERVDSLRIELFGSRMNHGGLCRHIFDRLDGLLLELLRLKRDVPLANSSHTLNRK